MVMYKRIALFVLALLLAISSLSSMINEVAFAASDSYFTDEIASSAKKNSTAHVYFSCFKQGNYIFNPDGQNAANNGDLNDKKEALLFHSASGKVNAGVSGYGGDDNVQNCGSLSITSFVSFMNGIGFSGSNPRAILCSINKESQVLFDFKDDGLTVDKQCKDGKNLYVVRATLIEAIKKKGNFTITDAQLYYIYYQIVRKYCNVTDKGTDKSAITETNYPIQIFNKDGTSEEHRFTTDKAKDKLNTINNESDGSQMTEFSSGDKDDKAITCSSVMRRLIGYSEQPPVAGYREYLKKIAAAEAAAAASKGGTAASTSGSKEYEEACKSLGYSSGKALEACAEGFRHLSDGAFCTTKYKDSPEELAACQAAQGSTKEAPPPADEEAEDQENCKIDYIGWVICPVVNTLASMSEGARARLVKMLTVDTKSILGDTSEGSVYSYWAKIRDYANILFVVFFLFVIFSQITGYGLDNYGIKRMLPKLVIGAIVVNSSFYICGLLIDLSNVVGSSAFNFISTAAVGGMPAGDWNDSDQGWISGIAAGALLLTVGYFALATVISVLLFVVITAVTTIFLLGVREAIIILCTVISPLAFTAMIMPNTEGLYKKWWNVFKAALMVFPMVGLVYGASNLAARVLGASIEDNDFILKSVITLLIFAPLLVVPKLVRNAVEIIGIGGAIAWANKKMNKGRDKMTDKVGKWRENKLTSQFGKHRREKAQLRNAQIRGGTYRGKGGIANFRNWRSAANRRLNAKSGDFGQKRKLVGSMALLEEDKERMKMANAWIADNNMSSDRLAEIATGVDKDGNKVDLKGISSYQRRAAMQALAPHMTGKQAADLAIASASFGDASLQKEAADAIGQSGAKKAPWVGGKQLEAIRQGTYNEQAAMSDYIRDKVSGEGLANAGAEQIRQMVTFAAQNSRNGDNSYMHSLSRARADLENDPKRAGGLQNAVRREINNIPLPQNHGSGGGNNQNNQNNQNNRDQGGNDQGGNDNNQGDDN